MKYDATCMPFLILRGISEGLLLYLMPIELILNHPPSHLPSSLRDTF
jgi:hypothetical protein